MHSTTAGKRYDGYIRVSRLNGRSGDSFISPQVQRDAIERWASQHGATIVQWREELDRSAREGKQRPEFDALLARAQAGESDGIVVWKLSRFGRSLIESATRIREIEQAGGQVLSATEGDQSKLTRTILLAIAEDEGDRLAEGRRDAYVRAAARGVWIGRAPLGYERDEDGRLVVVEATAAIVREAFRIAASRDLPAACDYLQLQLPDLRWTTSDARRILRSRAYLGEHHAPDGVGHVAIIDLPTFTAAQTRPRARRRNGDYVLSGIATCGECGAGLTGQRQTVRDRTYRRYRCSNVAGCGGGSSVNADKLEAYVREMIAVGLEGARFELPARVDGLEQAEVALRAAEADLRAFSTNTEFLRALGPVNAAANARALADEVDDARDLLGKLAASAHSEQLPAADQVRDDDDSFLVALRATVAALPIARGRGTLAQRTSGIRFVGDDLDDAARAAA